MICRQCGTENSESAKYCKGCGALLEARPAPQPVRPVQANAEPERNFCPECGTINAIGAKFCKACGSKLNSGAAAGNAANKARDAAQRFRQSSLGGNIMPMIKMSFAAPVDAIRRAHEDQDNWLATLIAIIVKALIIAVIPTMKIRSMIIDQVGQEAWDSYKDEVADQLGFSFSGMFMALLVISLLCDAAMIFGLFGIGKAFGGSSQLKNWIGAFCPTAWIGMCGSLIVVFSLMTVISGLQHGGGKGAMIFAGIVLAIVFIWQIVLMWKAFDIEMDLPENKAVYAFVVGMTVSIVVAALCTRLISGMVFSNIVDTVGDSMF